MPTLVPNLEPETPPDGPRPAPARAPAQDIDLARLLAEAMGLGAFDVYLQAGRPASFHGPRGSSTRGEPLTREALVALAGSLGTSVDHEAVEVRGLQLEAVGRVRLSSSSAGLAFRVLGPSAFLAPGLDRLLGFRSGLVVIGGPPASGRSTSFSALLHDAFDTGRTIASLEEPVSFPRCDAQWNVGPDRLAPFLKAVDAAGATVVGFDLVDDAVSVDLALDMAATGRLAICTMLGLSTGALLQRLVVLDAPAQRRRVAEHLRAIACLTPAGGGIVLCPSDALRQHLREHATLPPGLGAPAEGT